MKLWHHLLITLIAMLLASYSAGRLWIAMFDVPLPSYMAGLMGGLTALPVWELLRYFRSRVV
jgi:hypothetical protein